MSRLGLGTYRIRGDATRVVSMAHQFGIRDFDTAPNYLHGLAEECVAKGLEEVPNSDVQVSTKAGYDQGGLLETMLTRGELAYESTHKGRHCIAPVYVGRRVRMSSRILGKIGTLFLHNPEHALVNVSAERAARLVCECFDELETLCHEGTISSYGVATWSLFSGTPFTVSWLLEQARVVSGDHHHFHAVQMPVNLLEIEVARLALAGMGPIAEAQAAGLHVYASAPLAGGQIMQLGNAELARHVSSGMFDDMAKASLLFCKSIPGIEVVLASASTEQHLKSFGEVSGMPNLDRGKLQSLIEFLT